MKRILALSLMFMFLLGMTACGKTSQETPAASESAESSASSESGASETLSNEPTAESTVPAPEGEKDSTAENPGHFNLETATVTLNSGYEMPIMGLGTYSLSDEECYNSVTALLEAGGSSTRPICITTRLPWAGPSGTAMYHGKKFSLLQNSTPASLMIQRPPSSWHWIPLTSATLI